MAAPSDQATTVEELLALPEDGMRHELLDGVHVVTPAPRRQHQQMLAAMWFQIARVLHEREDLEILSSPADLVLGPRTLVQPDLFVLTKQPDNPAGSWADAYVPLIAIEILSPATAARDRGAKRRIYQRAGVTEYWIVDLDARLVERWTPGDERPEIGDSVLEWELPGGVSGEIELPSLFRRVLGE